MATNLTVDDFDPLVVYSNYDHWSTPNPQDNPTWWKAGRSVTNSTWHQATYHYTGVVGAQASFNFTGSSIAVYGGTGATGSIYTVSLDGNVANLQLTNSPGRTLLYDAKVTDGAHELIIVNGGSGLLLDLFVVGLTLGGEGVTLSNTTLDDRNPSIAYLGNWTQQAGPNFHSETSTYTSGPGNAVSLIFSGSAVYVYGDQVNDHGDYTVTLNGSVVGQYTGRSGCGGGYAKACEKLHGLKFFASGLSDGTHALRIENGGPAEGNKSFFDLDYVEYTVSSGYSSGTGSGAACTSGTCSASAPSPTVAGSSGAKSAAAPVALLCGVLAAWFAKTFL
ncbi:hypothetical protein CcaverHIS002_0408110 [Cutaneotrichosporon cavernicola]|uniref:Uncharacterized protein n=1 Tax=Cutaneotrichosporon cavernicola TaxID=279322 RepID=A0AA48L4T5_9TREE|nr:uncharacterized protein CcaverHIS019_0408090 [Cutaneotrichosporon cavernicola]BEI84207.1 hypothetical protein CcaverHIS002_0408110 [Cutaneotrichosporon cavernicola]BEI91989.1 hypothetical protein CcaverHIS019_0408090 [Cutaneotrichosporon cavernicola]BEI99760.1 hypothetical protein CcaverHIS631_0408030 [Cutaneotrichosporon cavernicola]BEJ07536.1 hypothetical protein CcaverHIS641_0408050 [Cutaneotrichosporon cavernicola]